MEGNKLQDENEKREPNPWIEGEDYYSDYNKSIKANYNKNHFKFVETTKAVFDTPKGREWLAMVKQNLFLTYIDLGSKNCGYQMAALQGNRAIIKDIELLIIDSNKPEK